MRWKKWKQLRIVLYDKHYNRKDVTKIVVGYLCISLPIIISFMFLFGSHKVVVNKTKFIPAETKVMIVRESNKFSKQKLKKLLKDLRIKFPKIVYAQALIESGTFKSHIFKVNNNLFGMKMPHSRPTTALGVRHNHAYYSSWRESVYDYALFSAAYLKDIRTEAEYLNYIGSYYAESPGYKEKIKSLIKKL